MKRLNNNKLYLLLTLVLVAFAYLYTSLFAQTSSDRISMENYNDLPNSRRLVTKLNIKHIEENKVEVSWVGIYHPNLMYYVYRSEDPILSKTVLTNAKVVGSTKATNASTTYTIYDNLPKYDKYYYAVISYIDNINFYTATENMDLMQFEYYDPFNKDMTNFEINTNQIITNLTNGITTNDTNSTYFTNDMLTNIVNSNDFLSYYPNTNLFNTNYSILPPTNYVDLYYTTNRIDSNRGIVFTTNYYSYTNYYNFTNNYTNYYNTTKIYIINPTNNNLSTNEIDTNDLINTNDLTTNDFITNNFITNDFTNQSRMIENVTNELQITSYTNDKNENIVNVEIKQDTTKTTPKTTAPTEYQRYSSEYQRALTQFKANNYAGAIRTLEPISRKKVDSALYYDINLLLGKSYKNAGRKKNALDTLKRIKSINPNEVNFWINQVLSDL